jgi:hypothetical protein
MGGVPEIVPYCIFHQVDSDLGSYMGHIMAPTVRRKDGVAVYECLNSPLYPYSIYDRFYAISPLQRPIPPGMQMFCARRSEGFPFLTTHVQMVYDVYNVKDENSLCTFFLAYSQPVPNTVPLYLHSMGENVFPSYDSDPPSNDAAWGSSPISPIYVLTPESVGLTVDTMNDTLFKCVDSRCLPWKAPGFTNVFDMSDTKPLPLQECLVMCNEIGSTGRAPTSLLDAITRKTSTSPPKLPRRTHPLVIGLVVGIFVFVVLIVVILGLKNIH